MGHFRPKWTFRAMSGLVPIREATELQTSPEVRFAPLTEVASSPIRSAHRLLAVLFNFYRRWLCGQHFIDLEDGRQVSKIGYIAHDFGCMRLESRSKRLE